MRPRAELRASPFPSPFPPRPAVRHARQATPGGMRPRSGAPRASLALGRAVRDQGPTLVSSPPQHHPTHWAGAGPPSSSAPKQSPSALPLPPLQLMPALQPCSLSTHAPRPARATPFPSRWAARHRLGAAPCSPGPLAGAAAARQARHQRGTGRPGQALLPAVIRGCPTALPHAPLPLRRPGAEPLGPQQCAVGQRHQGGGAVECSGAASACKGCDAALQLAGARGAHLRSR